VAVGIGKRAAMAAGLDALRDQRVGAGPVCLLALVGLGDGDPRGDSVAV
jgi:hypothetical protein